MAPEPAFGRWPSDATAARPRRRAPRCPPPVVLVLAQGGGGGARGASRPPARALSSRHFTSRMSLAIHAAPRVAPTARRRWTPRTRRRAPRSCGFFGSATFTSGRPHGPGNLSRCWSVQVRASLERETPTRWPPRDTEAPTVLPRSCTAVRAVLSSPSPSRFDELARQLGDPLPLFSVHAPSDSQLPYHPPHACWARPRSDGVGGRAPPSLPDLRGTSAEACRRTSAGPTCAPRPRLTVHMP